MAGRAGALVTLEGGRLVGKPVLGGLHHDDRFAARVWGGFASPGCPLQTSTLLPRSFRLEDVNPIFHVRAGTALSGPLWFGLDFENGYTNSYNWQTTPYAGCTSNSSFVQSSIADMNAPWAGSSAYSRP